MVSTKLRLKYRSKSRSGPDHKPKPKYTGTVYEEFPRDNKTGVPVIPT